MPAARCLVRVKFTHVPRSTSYNHRVLLAATGPTITADHILVFAGAQVALQTAAIALASDCHTIVFTPGYQSTCPLVAMPSHARSSFPRLPAKVATHMHLTNPFWGLPTRAHLRLRGRGPAAARSMCYIFNSCCHCYLPYVLVLARLVPLCCSVTFSSLYIY